jgi:acetyl esterase/lipase
MTGPTDAVLATDQSVDLPVRVTRDAAARPAGAVPLVLHLHGGAFCGGGAATSAVPGLLAEAGAVVLSAEYPLAPRHPFPDALRLVFSALKGLARQRSRFAGRRAQLFIAGEEAGGNLAASLALIARDQQMPQLAGQILLSPMLDPCLATTSIRGADAGPAGCKWADGWQSYLGQPGQASHPYAAPGQSQRLQGVAPALIVTAQDDPMRDESLGYAARLRQSGVPVREHVLAAPTAWPDALGAPPAPAAAWPAALITQFTDFFADAAALLRRPAVHRFA